MDTSCPAKRLLIFDSYFFFQLSPSLETFTVTRQKHDVQSCSLADRENYPAELCGRCPIVFLLRHQFLQSWHRCASVPPGSVSPHIWSTREVAWLPQQPCVHADSRRLRPAPRSSYFLPEYCQFVCCLLSALCQFSTQFTLLPGQTRRKLLFHRSDGFFCHHPPEVLGARCLPQTIQLVQFVHLFFFF